MSGKSFPINLRHNSVQALNDPTLRSAMRSATGLFTTLRDRGVACLPLDSLRHEASTIKNHVLDNLEAFVNEFSSNATMAGAVVHRAEDAGAAGDIILNILKDNRVSKIVKAKSMVSEEIHLNHLLERNDIKAVETDVGEFIIQLAGETPSHILGPAIHRNRNQIGLLFSEKLGVEYSEDHAILAKTARRFLRTEFLTAGAGFSGVNFAIAESGSLAIFTNEGNGRMCTTVPSLHIALLSTEKIIPRLKDLALFSRLLTRSSTGQSLSSYMSLITGARKHGESTGASKLHIVILDNYRTEILKGPFRDILKCIRCSACMNVCPVYRAIGGHAYDSTYPGPMGIALTNLLEGFNRAHPLLDACTLCGACDEVCPVKISFIKLINALREKRVDLNLTSATEKLLSASFGAAVNNPSLYKFLQKLSSAGLPIIQSVYKDLYLDRFPKTSNKIFRNR